jgi:hypothetical protein
MRPLARDRRQLGTRRLVPAVGCVATHAFGDVGQMPAPVGAPRTRVSSAPSRTRSRPNRAGPRIAPRLFPFQSDAAVYRDGRKLRSRTPLTLELRPGERVQLRLAKGGRKDRTVTVEGKTRDQTVRIKLQRRGFGGGGSSIGIPNDDPGIPGGGL